jgi:glycosyltransferase involved in cell wall biosynthesis
MAALVALLRDDRPRWVELHHLTGHDPAIARLGAALAIPYDMVLHDFAGICPRITLCGASGRYCGEPVDSRDCDDCVADTQDRLFDPMPVASLRARTARLAAAARMVIAPSEDAAHRLARYIRPRAMEIRGWETDLAGAPPPVRAPGRDVHVCLAGAIGEEKGYRVLLACARDAARRALALRFTLVGHSVDDSRLLDTGRVTITGAYREDEAAALVRAQQADIGLLPSVWPETWCYSLSYLLAAGLWPVAFDLGAQAERIRRTGSGSLLPLGLPAARINDFLLDIGTVTTTNRAGKP